MITIEDIEKLTMLEYLKVIKNRKSEVIRLSSNIYGKPFDSYKELHKLFKKDDEIEKLMKIQNKISFEQAKIKTYFSLSKMQEKHTRSQINKFALRVYFKNHIDAISNGTVPIKSAMDINKQIIKELESKLVKNKGNGDAEKLITVTLNCFKVAEKLNEIESKFAELIKNKSSNQPIIEYQKYCSIKLNAPLKTVLDTANKSINKLDKKNKNKKLKV